MASPARIQEVLLGGVQHYRADRAACQSLLGVLPRAAALAARSRSYLEDTVRRLALAGTAQFVELGCGRTARPGQLPAGRSCGTGRAVPLLAELPAEDVHHHRTGLVRGRDVRR